MTEKRRSAARLQLLFIAAVFFLPLLVAAVLYYSGNLVPPTGKANNGALLEPVVNLSDELPESPLYEHGAGHWLLVYENGGACDADCEEALYSIRQMRLMLGKEMGRVRRIFLHGETPPDTVLLAAEHRGLISLQDDILSEFLKSKIPSSLAAGGYFLIDPHTNLVMYFHPGIDPNAMVADIKRLLKLSRIG